MKASNLETRLLSSLIKVFADEELKAKPWTRGSMLSNEVYSFQLAYCWRGRMLKNINVRIESELSPWIPMTTVPLVFASSSVPAKALFDAISGRVTVAAASASTIRRLIVLLMNFIFCSSLQSR